MHEWQDPAQAIGSTVSTGEAEGAPSWKMQLPRGWVSLGTTRCRVRVGWMLAQSEGKRRRYKADKGRNH